MQISKYIQHDILLIIIYLYTSIVALYYKVYSFLNYGPTPNDESKLESIVQSISKQITSPNKYQQRYEEAISLLVTSIPTCKTLLHGYSITGFRILLRDSSISLEIRLEGISGIIYMHLYHEGFRYHGRGIHKIHHNMYTLYNEPLKSDIYESILQVDMKV